MYVKFNGTQVVKFPYTFADFANDNPNVDSGGRMPSADELPQYSAALVQQTPAPTFDPRTQVAEQSGCMYDGDKWITTWSVRALTSQEQAAAAAALTSQIVDATQGRLDAFARTRNYDGILSATTYADSLVQRFRTEGQYCLAARDQTWAALYQVLDEVQAGLRPIPNSFADIEPLLPTLEWPA